MNTSTRKGLAPALILALATSAFCQPPPETVTVSGIVTDATTAEPVPDATVWLRMDAGGPDASTGAASDRELATQTDGDGRFSFEKVIRGRYSISVHAVAYHDQELSHDATGRSRARRGHRA